MKGLISLHWISCDKYLNMSLSSFRFAAHVDDELICKGQFSLPPFFSWAFYCGAFGVFYCKTTNSLAHAVCSVTTTSGF